MSLFVDDWYYIAFELFVAFYELPSLLRVAQILLPQNGKSNKQLRK
jgi:hypothetical protein